MANEHAGIDAFGRIESRGIDYIPEDERHSSPRNMFWMLAGAQLCFTLFVWGWLPIVFGLGWWSAVGASTVGLAIGSFIVAPVAMLGPVTGTNTAVSSGAFFGVLGRLVGSLVALFIGIGALALTIWTSGAALVASAHRLFGWGNGDVALAIGFVIPSVVVVVVSVYGHANLVTVQKFAAPAVGLLILVGFIVLAPQFDSSYAGGEYLLGSYWPTWILAAVTALSAPISYAPFLNDYSRYISTKRAGRLRVARSAGLGVFAGLWVAVMFGAYAATIFTDKSLDFATGLVAISPTWYVVPLLLLGVVGTVGQGSLALYGTGLDTSSLFPRVTRLKATLAVSVVGIALVYLGAFVWNAIDLVTAFITILTIISAPWVAIIIIGYIAVRADFAPLDLQVFVQRRSGGRYWYTGGWNIVAMVAWIVAVVVGLLCTQTSLFVGPWANAAGGVDLSFVSSFFTGALLYGIAVAVDPAIADVRRRRGGESYRGDAVPSEVALPDDIDGSSPLSDPVHP